MEKFDRLRNKRSSGKGLFFGLLLIITCAASGCGSRKEADLYSTEVVKLTITPAPSPTPEPVVEYPAATVSGGGITMVNRYLADASDGKNPYAGKAAEVNKRADDPDEEETAAENTTSTASEAAEEETDGGAYSGVSISSYYDGSGSSEEEYSDGSYDYDEDYDSYYDSYYGYDES